MATFYSNISSYYQLRLDISQASQDITNNTSSVYYKLTLTSGYSSFAKWGHIRWLVINGATVYSETSQIAIGAQSSLVLAEGYTTVSHNSDGTKTVSFSASFDSGGSRPAYIVQTALVLSGTLALTTIPRASTISRIHASRALGETQTFSIDRASGSFTHTVRYRIGSGGWTNIATGVATSQTWTLPASLASSVTNDPKATITVECLTYNGGTHIGTSSTSFEMTIPNNSTYQPNVSINSGYPSIVNPLGGVAVQGKSKIRVISSYSGNYGATITSVRVTINGVNYNGQDVTSAVINTAGNVAVTVTVTDTRGYSKTTAPVNVNFVEYSNPRIETFTVVRHPTNQDTGVRIKVKFNVDSVNNKNTTSYSIKYTPLDGATVTVVSSSSVYSVDETIDLLSGTALADTTYTFHLQVDDHYNSISRTVVLGTAFELINFNKSGQGIAFGKYSEIEEGVEFNLPIFAHDVFNGTLIKNSGNILSDNGRINSTGGDNNGFLTIAGNTTATLKFNRRGVVLLVLDQGGSTSASKGAWFIWLGANTNGNDYTRIIPIDSASNFNIVSYNLNDDYTTIEVQSNTSGSARISWIVLQ